MWKAIAKIFESAALTSLIVSTVFILVGLSFFFISALGAIPLTSNTIADSGWRLALALVGIVAAAGGFLKLRNSPSEIGKIDLRRFGLKITHPQPGDIVGENYDVTGTYEKKPPENYEIEIIEIDTGGHSLTYRPRRRALPGPNNTWRAKEVFGGADNQSGRERIIFVALVGKSGQALCDYYHKVGKTYDFEKRPSLNSIGDDIIECDRIQIRRK